MEFSKKGSSFAHNRTMGELAQVSQPSKPDRIVNILIY